MFWRVKEGKPRKDVTDGELNKMIPVGETTWMKSFSSFKSLLYPSDLVKSRRTRNGDYTGRCGEITNN